MKCRWLLCLRNIINARPNCFDSWIDRFDSLQHSRTAGIKFISHAAHTKRLNVERARPKWEVRFGIWFGGFKNYFHPFQRAECTTEAEQSNTFPATGRKDVSLCLIEEHIKHSNVKKKNIISLGLRKISRRIGDTQSTHTHTPFRACLK